MGFLDDFFGKSQKRDIQQAYGRASSALESGIASGRASTTAAIDRVDPWVGTGRNANAMYADAIGLNGQAPQQGVVDNFMADPFRADNERLANENLMRQFNGRTGPGAESGAFHLATARGNLERGSADWNHWLDRISDVSTQGLGAAGTQAGLEGQMGAMEYDAGNARAANEINFGNAMAQSRGVGINNLLGVAGLAVRGFTPGWGGDTAFGNIAGAFRGQNAMDKWDLSNFTKQPAYSANQYGTSR